MEQSIEVEIDATAQQVWALMSDVARWPEWTATVTAVTRLDDGPLAVGSRTKVEQPKLPTAEYVVTELEPGRGFTWVATAPGVRTTARHSVEPRGEGAVAHLSVEQAGPLGVVMGRLFLAGLTERYLATEAAGLKARAQGQAGAG